MIGASVRPDRKAMVQFALLVAGIVLMVAGFLARAVPLVVIGGLAAVTSVIVFIPLLLRAVPRRRRWTLPATGSMLALGYLVLTVSGGRCGILVSDGRFVDTRRGVYSPVGALTSSTGAGWWGRNRAATLPVHTAAMPDRAWVAITTRSA